MKAITETILVTLLCIAFFMVMVLTLRYAKWTGSSASVASIQAAISASPCVKQPVAAWLDENKRPITNSALESIKTKCASVDLTAAQIAITK